MNGEMEDHKKQDQIINTVLKHLSFLQYHPLESASTRGNLLFSAMLYIAVQPVIAICTNWQQWNFNSRVSAVDNLIYSYGVLCLSIDIYILSGKLKTLLILSNSEYKLYSISSKTRYISGKGNLEAHIPDKGESDGEITSEEWKRIEVNKNVENIDLKTNDFFDKKQELVRRITLEANRRARITANVVSYFFISFAAIPLSGVVSYFLQLKSIDNLPLLFLIYSPFSFSLTITSFLEYTFLTLVELFYIYYTAILAISGHVLQLLSITNLLGEMKLFHLNAKEIDWEFENVLNEADKEANLRLAARELVIHHQTIFKKIKQLNDASNFRLFYVNSYMCMQLVFGIFIFLKGEFVYKVKYSVMLITIILTEYIFSENGQRLQDEGEELRMALYGCNWIDKPTWYAKALQILMTRNNNLPKIGLFYLFTLNRNNVTVVIRGAYSYFSILNNISS